MKKITFFSTAPGLNDLFPIIAAADYRPNWVKSMRAAYKEKYKAADGDRFTHVYRCPGIYDVMKTGFVVRMPWDVMIETYGDGKNFKWTLPSTDLQYVMKTTFVAGHSGSGADIIPNKEHSLQTIIKFNTPWYVIVPKDIKFLVIPIPYPDSHEFESVHGLLDPSISAEINFQIRWNKLNGKHIIRAGTPMCQLIPLSTEKFELEVRDATDHDLAWIQKRNYFFNFGFLYKRNIIKEMYEKYFNRR